MNVTHTVAQLGVCSPIPQLQVEGLVAVMVGATRHERHDSIPRLYAILDATDRVMTCQDLRMKAHGRT